MNKISAQTNIVVRRRRGWLVLPSLLVAGAAFMYIHDRGNPKGSAPVTAAPEAVERLEPAYPKARWRLAPPGALGHVMLWVSHILVRYEGVDRRAPFGLAGWDPLPTAPARTREQALDIARRLAREARSNASSFEALARAQSEDLVTRDDGGSLGGVDAGVLESYPEVLDAIAALRPGETSEVVETAHGFHIFQRRPVAPAVQVAGRRIVIGYAGATWLRGHSRSSHKPLERSREEALHLAGNIAAELKTNGQSFDSLLDQNSDDEDVSQGGDIGCWSTHEAGGLEREREQLSRLKVGEVSKPIDSSIGFQVYVRTEAAPRPEYAMNVIRIRYSDGAPAAAASSHASARDLAESIARTLGADPSRFSAFQAEYCCAGTVRWTSGRQPTVITQAVSQLAPGSINRSPIDVESSFVIPMRVALDSLPEVTPVVFDLPEPELPDVMAFAKSVRGPGVQKFVRHLRDDAPAALSLDERRATEFRAIHDSIVELFGLKFAGDRQVGLAAQFVRVRALLTEAEYRQYERYIQDAAASSLMGR